MTRDNSQMTLEVFGADQSDLGAFDDKSDQMQTDAEPDSHELMTVATEATGETPEPRIIDDATTPAVTRRPRTIDDDTTPAVTRRPRTIDDATTPAVAPTGALELLRTLEAAA